MNRTWTVATAFLLIALVQPAAWAEPVSHLGLTVAPDDVVLLRWQCNEGTPTRILSDGTRIEDFAIPRRHVLVLTDLEWRVTSIAGSEGLNYIVEAQLSDDVGFVSGVYLAFIELIQDRGYLSDHLTSALMLDSAVTLDNDVAAPDPRFSLFGVAPGAGEVPNCHAILRGYLARARRR